MMILFHMTATIATFAGFPFDLLLYRPHRHPGEILDRDPMVAARIHARLEGALDRATAILAEHRDVFNALIRALFEAQALDEQAVLQILTRSDLQSEAHQSCDRRA